MVHVLTRVLGALVALSGLALAAVGVWFATELGGSGTATFTARPGTADPVVLQPDVLNRVDAQVTVTATPSSGGRIWIALANPSDAEAVLGDARRVEATGVSVQDWVLRTASQGSGDAADLSAAELWRNQDDGTEALEMTVDQANAPETVIALAEEGTVETVTMTVENKTWFVEAVIAALVGLFLLAVGLVVVWPRRRRRTGADAGPAAGVTATGADAAGPPTDETAELEPMATTPAEEDAPAEHDPAAPGDTEQTEPHTTKEATP